MQALIPTTSDLYGKRLVKAIRESFEHGVYLDHSVAQHDSNPRIHSVRFSAAGTIFCITNRGEFHVDAQQWVDAFFDGYGREIFASRRAK